MKSRDSFSTHACVECLLTSRHGENEVRMNNRFNRELKSISSLGRKEQAENRVGKSENADATE